MYLDVNYRSEVKQQKIINKNNKENEFAIPSTIELYFDIRDKISLSLFLIKIELAKVEKRCVIFDQFRALLEAAFTGPSTGNLAFYVVMSIEDLRRDHEW